MVPKEIQDLELGILIDGDFREIGYPIQSIDDFEIDSGAIENIKENLFQEHELVFETAGLNPVDELTFVELWMVLSGACKYEQITSNNWRRMHGIPMNRGRKRSK